MTGPIEILYYKAAYPAVSQAVRVRRAGTPAVRVGKHGQPVGWPCQQDGGGTKARPQSGNRPVNVVILYRICA